MATFLSVVKANHLGSSSTITNMHETPQGLTLSLLGMEWQSAPQPPCAPHNNLHPLCKAEYWGEKYIKRRNSPKGRFSPQGKGLPNAGMNKLWKAFTTERDIIIIHVKQICLFCKDSFQLINYQYLLMVEVTSLLWWENYRSTCLEYLSLSTYCINLAYLSCSFCMESFFLQSRLCCLCCRIVPSGYGTPDIFTVSVLFLHVIKNSSIPSLKTPSICKWFSCFSQV